MAKVKVDNDSVWTEFRTQGTDYQDRMGFSSKWPEFTRFVEGNQWPAATSKTKYMPRPVINQCDFIVENKQSNILSQSLKMLFSPEEIPEEEDNETVIEAAENYTDAATTTWEDIDQDALNEEVVNDTLVIGTGIWHYYWDSSIKGGTNTPYVGKIQGESIDPMDFIVGNPHLPSNKVQKQPWIIIRTFPNTNDLKERAPNPDEIYPDTNNDQDINYDTQRVNLNKPNTTTLLTKYYKENGQVYWMETTRHSVITESRPLSPEGSKPFVLYPIEVLNFKRRRKCTFGRSVIEDIIPNQKSLNWGLGMMLLSIQQTAWPKIIAKLGALKQSITNEPGEIITDHGSMQGLEGIKYMQPPNFSSTPVTIAEKILDMTRQVTGTTEVNSGELLGANMAASAIIALQNQAKKPNEGYQTKLFRSIRNIGRIWEEFYKTYHNMPVPIKSKNDDGVKITKAFVGTEHADKGFGLSIDVGPASVYSESLQVSVIDKLHDSKEIDKYAYVKYMPSNIVPSELKSDFEKEKQKIDDQAAQMESANNQAAKVHSALSPEEQEALQNDPSLVDKAMAYMQGGEQIGPTPM